MICLEDEEIRHIFGLTELAIVVTRDEDVSDSLYRENLINSSIEIWTDCAEVSVVNAMLADGAL